MENDSSNIIPFRKKETVAEQPKPVTPFTNPIMVSPEGKPMSLSDLNRYQVRVLQTAPANAPFRTMTVDTFAYVAAMAANTLGMTKEEFIKKCLYNYNEVIKLDHKI